MTGCEAIREELSAYLDGELAPPAEEEVRQHLAGCEACRLEHAGLVELSLGLEALPRLTAPAHFTAQVMARVVESPPQRAAEPARKAASGRLGTEKAGARPVTGRTAPGRPAAEPAAPAAPAAPPGCVPDEDLSALLDGALETQAATLAAGHLAGCARCREVQAGLAAVRELVRGLPALTAPPGFAAGVLERITAWEREEERRAQAARAARAQWWGWASWGARAAGFLLVLGVGASWSTPETRPLAWGGGWSGGQAARPPAAPRPSREEANEAEPPELPAGPYDATVELSSAAAGEAGFVAAPGAAQEVIARFGSLEGLPRPTPRSWSCVVRVPANQADDLLRGLVATRELDGGREVEDVVARVSTELDRVELRGGQVYVGQAEARKDGGVVVRLGGLALEVAPRDLARIERSGDVRRLRIEVRARE